MATKSGSVALKPDSWLDGYGFGYIVLTAMMALSFLLFWFAPWVEWANLWILGTLVGLLIVTSGGIAVGVALVMAVLEQDRFWVGFLGVLAQVLLLVPVLLFMERPSTVWSMTSEVFIRQELAADWAGRGNVCIVAYQQGYEREYLCDTPWGERTLELVHPMEK